MPSPDGRYWRCIWNGEIKCFFAPFYSDQFALHRVRVRGRQRGVWVLSPASSFTETNFLPNIDYAACQQP